MKPESKPMDGGLKCPKCLGTPCFCQFNGQTVMGRPTPSMTQEDRGNVVKSMVFEIIDPKALKTSWAGHYTDIAERMLTAIEAEYRLVRKDSR